MGTVDADLENAPTEQIARAITPLVERIERDREHALVARIEQGIGTGGAAATGLDGALSQSISCRTTINASRYCSFQSARGSQPGAT